MLIMQNAKMVAEYLLENLKDNLDDLEDEFCSLNRQYKHKFRECELLQKNLERTKKDYYVLQEALQAKCQLVERNGIVINNQLFHKTECHNGHLTNGHSLAGLCSDDRQHQCSRQLANGCAKGCPNGVLTSSDDKLTNLNYFPYSNSYLFDLKNSYNIQHLYTSSINHDNASNGHFSMANGINGQLADSFCSERQAACLLDSKPDAAADAHSKSNVNSRFVSGNAGNVNGEIDSSNDEKLSLSKTCNANTKTCSTSGLNLLFSDQLHQYLHFVEGSSLNDKIAYLLRDKKEKLQRMRLLRSSLDDEKIKNIKLEGLSLLNGKQPLNGTCRNVKNSQAEDTRKMINNYESELKRLGSMIEALGRDKQAIDDEISELQLHIERLEKAEQELKTEKRKILRQFREAQIRIDELDTENYHLQKRIDKLSKNSKLTKLSCDQ